MVANCAGSGIAHNGGLQFECDTTNNNYTLFLTPEIFYYHHHIRDAICQDEHYLKYGFDIDDIQTGNAGTLLFQDTVLSDTDCDTVVYLTLDVYPVYEKVDIIDSCLPVEWNGKTYYESGNYVSRFSSTTGCDSTEYLYLTIPPAVYTHIRIEACDSYEWDGELYTESGTYSRKYSSSAGCDSTVTLHLTIIHLETTVENLTPDFCELHEAEIK